MSVISGFRRDVDDICALLGYYAALSGNSLPTLRDNLAVPSSRVGKSKIGPIRCPETSVKSYHSRLRNIPEKRRSQLQNAIKLSLSYFPYFIDTYVGFAMDKVALGQGFPRVLRFSPVSFIPPVLPYKEKRKKIVFITGLHKKPQGCGVSLASSAGPFTTPKNGGTFKAQ
jgi:hypothetical protein